MILRVANLRSEDRMDQESQPNGVASGAPPPDESAAPRKRTRPKKVLPTDRIAFDKQLDVLRAYVIESHEGERPATNQQIADRVGMTHSTVSLANPFFADIGLI